MDRKKSAAQNNETKNLLEEEMQYRECHIKISMTWKKSDAISTK